MCAGPAILQPRDHLESGDDAQTVTPRMQSTPSSLPFGGDLILQKSSEIMLCISLDKEPKYPAPKAILLFLSGSSLTSASSPFLD